MKKIWTLIACTLMAATVSFAQDDFDYEATEQTEVESEATEQSEDQANDQSEAVEEQAEDAASVQTAKQSNNQVANQTNIQQANQVNIQNNYYAQAETDKAEEQADNNSKPRLAESSTFGFGVRGAFNYARMYGFKEDPENDSDIDGVPTGIGFDAGLMLRIQMIPNLHFTPEVNFAYSSTSHSYLDKDRHYISTDIEIPLIIRGVVGDMFYVGAGPQINFNISNEADIDATENQWGLTEDMENIESAKFSFGLTAGAGINVVEGLFVDLRFYLGVTELFPDVKSLDEYEAGEKVQEGDNFSFISMKGAKMMKFKVGMSYWFI
jgi:hypothetical protein